MSRTRERLGTLALVLGSVGVSLALAEGVARWTWREPPPPAPPPRAAPGEALPELGPTDLVRPNVRGLYGGVVVETNRWGFRGPDVPRRKPPGAFRIVLVGDSIAMGQGVAYEDTYGARVERALRRDGHRVEVLNLGASGLDAGQIVERLKKVGAPLGPDLVVYGFTLNDIEGPFYRDDREAARAWAAERRARRQASARSPSYLWRVLEPRLASLRELLAPPPGSYVHTLNDNYFHNPAAWSALESVFQDLARGQRAMGACVHVLIHPRLHFLHRLHPFRRHYAAVAAAVRARGLTATVAFPHFLGEDAPSLWVSPTDPHPNARGHALLAEALLEGIAEDVPARCRPH